MLKQDVKVRVHKRVYQIKEEAPPTRQREASKMMECAQTNDVETKSNEEFKKTCFLMLHENTIEGSFDALDTGYCFVVRHFCP